MDLCVAMLYPLTDVEGKGLNEVPTILILYINATAQTLLEVGLCVDPYHSLCFLEPLHLSWVDSCNQSLRSSNECWIIFIYISDHEKLDKFAF